MLFGYGWDLSKMTTFFEIRGENGSKSQISLEAASLSDFLKTQTELALPDEGIDLMEFVHNQFTLDKLVEFLEVAKDKPTIRVSRPLKRHGELEESGVPGWAINWINSLFEGRSAEESWDTVFELMNAADFINYPSLLKVLCAKVASRICAMDEETKRIVFKPTRTLTPEEEEQIHEQNRWAEEDAPGDD
jgi:hypothetical protein